jgi:DNA-binding winged helix-turn-helix (wHTH) protein
LRYQFEQYSLDTDRRELRCGADLVPIEPQVFDVLEYLIRSRERVVSRDDLLAKIWDGRIVSDSALTTRINAARAAVGDSGEAQRLIKTPPRKGVRFVGAVREDGTLPEARAMMPAVIAQPAEAPAPSARVEKIVAAPTFGIPDGPSIAVLPFTNVSGDPEQDYFADGRRKYSPHCHGANGCLLSPEIHLSPTRASWSTCARSGASLVSVMCLKVACGVAAIACASLRSSLTRSRGGSAHLGRSLRGRADRRIRTAGPVHRKHRCRNRAEPAARGNRTAQEQARGESGRL